MIFCNWVILTEGVSVNILIEILKELICIVVCDSGKLL